MEILYWLGGGTGVALFLWFLLKKLMDDSTSVKAVAQENDTLKEVLSDVEKAKRAKSDPDALKRVRDKYRRPF